MKMSENGHPIIVIYQFRLHATKGWRRERWKVLDITGQEIGFRRGA